MTSPVFTTTKATGGTGTPTVMTFIEPAQTVLPDALADFAPGSGLNGEFLAEFLSAALAHEQCGVHLYRTAGGLSANPLLKAHYLEFLGQTETHVAVLERLITELGGSPGWVSPTARLVHGMNQKLLESVVGLAGSADAIPLETALLECVILAETKDQANWAVLATLAGRAKAGPAADALAAAVAEVEPQEDEHVGWARSAWERMTLLQAESKMAMKITEFTEKMFGDLGLGGIT